MRYVLLLSSLLMIITGAVLISTALTSVDVPVRETTSDETLVSAIPMADLATIMPPGMGDDTEAPSSAVVEREDEAADADSAAGDIARAGGTESGMSPAVPIVAAPSATLEPPTPTAQNTSTPAPATSTPRATTTAVVPATPRPSVMTPVVLNAPQTTAALPSLPNTLNIVLLGSDRRPGQSHWRTDTIIVVMVNPKTKQAGVISVHRDLWVSAPRGATKVNTVDMFNGTTGLKQTLTAFLGIPIDYYVRIDFTGMVKAIDAIGGITVEVDCALEEGYPDAGAPGGVRRLKVPSGRVAMTGQMALDFSRSRMSTSVSDRMKRQMRVLLGVREKLLSPSMFARIPELWSRTQNLVQTDLPPHLILPLAKLASEIKLTDVHGLSIDGAMARQTYSPQGWWILVPNLSAVRAAARNIFNAKPLTDAVRRAGCG